MEWKQSRSIERKNEKKHPGVAREILDGEDFLKIEIKTQKSPRETLIQINKRKLQRAR